MIKTEVIDEQFDTYLANAAYIAGHCADQLSVIN
jgi:hypothetical protein